MKWYSAPVSLLAYLLVVIFLFSMAWHSISGNEMAAYWWYVPAAAGGYLLFAFILQLLKFDWELEVLIQVALVLGPLLWYLNQREPYQPPVYVFIVKSDYEGELQVNFAEENELKTRVRSDADTLYFAFDDNGRILVREDYNMVLDALHNRLYTVNRGGVKKKILTVKENQAVPADSVNTMARMVKTNTDKGRIKSIELKVGKSTTLK
jgi:hypothetical protein